MIERMSGKRTVLLLVLVAASLTLVSGSREWVSGTTSDVVLGASALHGRGSDVAPGVMAAALVGLASAVAAATAGPVVRVVAICSTLLASALGSVLVISVLADPGGALGGLAVAGTGHTGTVAAEGQAGGWAWAALAAMLVMGIGGLGAVAGRRRWSGLPSRYDAVAPVGEPASRTSAASKASAWDQLSRGEDPTAGP